MADYPKYRPNMSTICRDFYKLSGEYSKSVKFAKSKTFFTDKILPIKNVTREHKSIVTIEILSSVEDAIREHRSNNGNKELAWNSFKFYSINNVEARYWVGYYYYHHGDDIPELRSINKEERNKKAINIFKETADKGNPSAQLRYGMYLWEKENYIEAFKYLKMSADAKDVNAMFIVGKAYLNGGKGIEQNKEQGTEYLKRAALKNHTKAREMCDANNISYSNIR